MVSFSCLVLAATAIGSVFAAPAPNTEISKRDPGTLAKRTDETGTNGGYYYSFWSDDAGTVSYANGPNGEYTVTWSGGAGNFVAGKGWNPGSAQ